MPTVERSPFLAGSLQKAVTTSASSESRITRDFERADTAREGWDLIERQLIEWGCDPGHLDEEGTQSPSPQTIQTAIRLASDLSHQGNASPTRVVPDAHGGIVFEFEGKGVFESVHVLPDGNIEHRLFQNHRLMHRQRVVLGPANTT